MDSFLLELLMSDQEKGLYQALLENPQDKATRNAYVDFLKENNRHVSAKQIEDGYTFRLGYAGREVQSGDGNVPYTLYHSGALTTPSLSPINHSILSPGQLASIRNHPINRS